MSLWGKSVEDIARRAPDEDVRLENQWRELEARRESLERQYPWPKDPRRDPGRWGRSDESRQQDMLAAILDALLEIKAQLPSREEP